MTHATCSGCVYLGCSYLITNGCGLGPSSSSDKVNDPFPTGGLLERMDCT